jgi:hypothetical protein
LAHNTRYSVESKLTLPRNMSPPSSWSKNKLSMKPAWKQVPSRALYPRRKNSSWPPLWEYQLVQGISWSVECQSTSEEWICSS